MVRSINVVVVVVAVAVVAEVVNGGARKRIILVDRFGGLERFFNFCPHPQYVFQVDHYQTELGYLRQNQQNHGYKQNTRNRRKGEKENKFVIRDVVNHLSRFTCHCYFSYFSRFSVAVF